MKITLEIHGNTYTAEEAGEDFNAAELKEIFSRLLVVATYPPDVIDCSDGGKFICDYKEYPDEN